jgi:hypothetical protein
MKIFKLTERIPAIVTYTYYVEAETEEDAMDKMSRGGVNNTKEVVEDFEKYNGEIEVEEVE